MGKTTKTNTESNPAKTRSVVTVNGLPFLDSSIKGNTLYSNYNFSPEEEALNKYVQESLLTNIPKINTFLPETIVNMNSEIEAYKNQGIDAINDVYKPMVQDLENDIVSRFGNFDNSIFMDNLRGLESQRAKAVSDFAQNVQTKRSELYNDELARQYNYLNFLSGYKNQTFQNMLDASRLNQSNLSLNNDYLTSLYALQNKTNTTKTNKDFSWNQIAGMLASAATFL